LELQKEWKLQQSHGLSFVSQSQNYEMRGKFMTKRYNIEPQKNAQFVTNIRKVFYNFIEKVLGRFTSRTLQMIDNKEYYVYEYKGRRMLMVPHYYHGIGVVTPHLSFVNITKIKTHNPSLYNAYHHCGLNALTDLIDDEPGYFDKINTNILDLEITGKLKSHPDFE